MRTLVTGATGFIGSAVVRALLARGRAVRVLVEPGARTDNLEGLEVERHVGTVLDEAAVARAVAGCEIVYHLAAIYRLWPRDDRELLDVNVEGSKNVLGAAHRAGARRIIYTSSIAALGRGAPGQVVDETVDFDYWDDANAYMRSKFLAERDARRLAREGAPIVIVCPAFPFGAGDLGPTPTGRFIIEALGRRVPGIVAGGFCAVDVDDVAACHLLAEARGGVGERYIAGAHNVSYRTFFDTISEVAGLPRIRWALPTPAVLAMAWAEERWAAVSGKPPRMTVASAVFATRTCFFDSGKAQALGMPVTPLAVTIERAVRYFRDRGMA